MTEHVEALGLRQSDEPPAAIAWLRRHAWLLVWWACGRALVLATALVVAAAGPTGFLRGELRGNALGLLDAWDGRWYRMIASEGYLLVPGRQSDPAFFPLFPLLLRGAHALGVGYAGAGILISNIAFLAALATFHALTGDLLGIETARRATTYLAIFPLGYVFSMSYPESIVLALVGLAGVAAFRRRWLLAAVCAGAASLARPEGLFLALPLLALVWRRRRTLSPGERGLALGAALAPAAGLAAYPLYLGWVLHDPLAWSRAEQAWGRRFAPLGFVRAFTSLPAAVAQNAWVLRDVAFLLLYLVLLAVARRAGTPWPWLLAALAIVVLPVFSASFDSIGRFGLLAPPVLWGLASLGRRPRVDVAIRVVSVVLLVAATATVPFVFP